ncbi:MAG: deoxyribose-phosphate aldolase [Saprospiraceae bacterium]|nr:deoxyribose-phosphate aldolase [Saprospiraceae bacterium]
MLNANKIAGLIDHSILHPTMTDDDLKAHCAIADEYGVATVCVKPYHVAMAADLLALSAVKICAVIGFPHGNNTIAMKVAETEEVISNGAQEVDMVVNAGKVLQHDWAYVKNEIESINKACVDRGAILKVIFETDFITDELLKIKLCNICSEAGVAFVKTSTGFGFVKQASGDYNYKGATLEDIRLLRQHCYPKVQIKASGGIRDLDTLIQLYEAGATRIGTSSTVQLVGEARLRFPEH